ncbi:2-dehydropantoate 2-reductase [Acinetobacter sp. ANC 4779]|uniref:ketopantoate reductase family protein n=1 Tax=Acinetobacter sp. ANC 4779 TaxID=2529848 RepID=UPI00103943A8|nr:2-dehydropantoate 2-reductase [Acinetobacter sp. ANC 4779]TCB50146.1 2-dehydropantoate 2-reductase [Acinetobacter sp. ANC 4779]
MKKETKISILGAGAIGCTLAARLILAGCEQVSLIARGENFQVLSTQGIQLTDLTGEYQLTPYRVVQDLTELDPQDIIFIATKSNALHQITAAVQDAIHAETVIIPLMNGIPFWYFYQGQSNDDIQAIKCLDKDRQLIERFPLTHLIGSVVFITAKLKAYGKVESDNPYLLILGEPKNQITERIQAVQALFADTGIELRVTDQIRDQIWTKVIANLSSNPLSVVTGAPLKDIYAHPHLHEMALQITQEVRQVAASYGARIAIDPLTFLQLGSNMGNVYTSMWHDYQKKQPLEMAGIAEAVFELAEQFNCPMPVTKHICNLTAYLSEQSRKI